MDKLNSDYELSRPPPIRIPKCKEDYDDENERKYYCTCIIINFIINKLSPITKKENDIV